MKPYSLFITIRLRQAFRLLQSIGWIYVFLFLIVVGIGVLGLLEKSLDGDYPVMGMAYVFLVGSIHFQRKDQGFLRLLSSYPGIHRLIDYGLLFIPILISLVILGCYNDLLLVFCALPIIAAIRPPQKSIGDYMPQFPVGFIPVMAYEWRTGFRRYGWIIAPVYVGALWASAQMGIGIIFILIFALIGIGFFDDLEEKSLLEIFRPAKGFLKRKIYWQAWCLHGFLLPHYILALVFHSAYWYLLLAAVLIAQSLLLFSLFYKYAHWHPHRKKAYNQVALGVYTASLIVPFLAPAGLFYCWVYYKKAQKNLTYYYE